MSDETLTPEPVAPEAPTPPPVAAAPKPKRHYRKHRRGIRRGPYAVRQAAPPNAAAPAAGGPPPAAGSSSTNGRGAHEAFLAAQEEYRDAVGDDSDEAARVRLQFRRLARKATHLQTCGPECVMVEMDVPAAATNPAGHDFFKINDDPYPPGRYTVWACRARELARMIDKNLRTEGKRMRESVHVLTAGAIRAQQIRAEN